MENSYRVTLAQILGGIAIAISLYYTWRRINIYQEGQITERFTRAVDQDQLYRRIRVCYKFYLDHVDLYRLNEETLKYQFTGSAPNVLKMKVIERTEIDERMLTATGFEFTPALQEVTEVTPALQEITEVTPTLQEVTEVAPALQEVTEAKPADMNLSWFLKRASEQTA
jgi:hypothetical protein